MDPSMAAQYIALLPDEVPYNATIQQQLDSFEVVDKKTFKVLIGLLCSVAVIAVAFRTFFHLRKRGHLLLDDGLVIFAGVCLVIQTSINYWGVDAFYLVQPLVVAPTLVQSKKQMLMALEVPKISMIASSFSYTANYSIKLSFLAFFRLLMGDISRKMRYYWRFVVGFVLVSWVFSVCSNLIMCPYFGMSSIQCFSRTEQLPVVVTVTLLDCLSDVMIASIPVLLMRFSQQLRPSQKLRILFFLCLNLVIIAFSITRSVGGRYHAPGSTAVNWSVPWIQFFHFLEAVVAVLMGCLTALRSVFGSSANSEKTTHSRSSLYYRIKKFLGLSSNEETSDGAQGEKSRPRYLDGPQTGGTFRGLRTFIRRHEREPGHTTIASTVDSIDDPIKEYHQFQGEQAKIGRLDSASTAPSFEGPSSSRPSYNDLPDFPEYPTEVHNRV